jgi:hypothetical protein
VVSTLDPAFASAFRAGTMTQAQAEVARPRDHLAATFFLLQLSSVIADKADTSSGGAHTPSGSIPPYAKQASKRRTLESAGGQPGHPGRSRPLPERIDRRESHALPACPDCGGELVRTGRTRTRVVEDIPADLKVEATEHTIHRDWCPACRKQVEPRVPDALPHCTLGNRVVTLAAWLHYGLGSTICQIVAVLGHHLRLTPSAGGLMQMWHRLAELFQHQRSGITSEAGGLTRVDGRGKMSLPRCRSRSSKPVILPSERSSPVRYAFSVLFIACVCLVSRADEDPIKAKLDAAEKTHATELKRAQQALLDSFDEREKTARTKGNKKLLDQIKAERAAFTEREECPPTALVKYEQRHSTANGRMIAAYKAAIREYTKAKKDDKASATEISLETFQRDRWKHMDVEAATVKDDFLQLNASSLTTKDQYSGPFEVVAVARTASKSLRLRAYSGSCVIFNWENNVRELRVARPDGSERGESGSVAATPAVPLRLNTWYQVRWKVSADRMEVYVNEKLVFVERRAYDLSGKGPISINTGGQGDVRFIRVAKLPNKAE